MKTNRINGLSLASIQENPAAGRGVGWGGAAACGGEGWRRTGNHADRSASGPLAISRNGRSLRIDTSQWSQADKGCLVTRSTNWNQWLIWWQFLTFPPVRIHKRLGIMATLRADRSPAASSSFPLSHTFPTCPTKMFDEATLPRIDTRWLGEVGGG